jgi:hypothetical protein
MAQGDVGTTVTGSELLTVRGGGTVTVRPTSLFDGVATVADGPDDTLPRSVNFPEYAQSGTYPVSVIKVTPTSNRAISPANHDFRFGAVFRLDARSSGRTVDDGDNVFQRGLNSDDSIYKLDISTTAPRAWCAGRRAR